MAHRYRLDLFPRTLALVIAGTLIGCGSLTPDLLTEAPSAKIPPLPAVAEADSAFTLYDVEVGTASLLTTDMAVRTRLNQAHTTWDGTPYRYGGTTPAGMDCSGFVQRVFTDYFGMALTRSTHSQVTEGFEVAREALRPGDLVFFRTGRRQRHVGVYIGNNRFLHASTRKGVTTDALDGYYDRSYWTARRVLSDEALAAVRADVTRISEAASRRPAEPPAASTHAPRTRPETTQSPRDRHAGW